MKGKHRQRSFSASFAKVHNHNRNNCIPALVVNPELCVGGGAKHICRYCQQSHWGDEYPKQREERNHNTFATNVGKPPDGLMQI